MGWIPFPTWGYGRVPGASVIGEQTGARAAAVSGPGPGPAGGRRNRVAWNAAGHPELAYSVVDGCCSSGPWLSPSPPAEAQRKMT